MNVGDGNNMNRWGGATWILAGVVLVALVLALAQIVHMRASACDDAYITYRFADNLVDGMGLRWNPESPPCEGYTNLLHLLLIAGLHWFGVDLALASLLVSVAAVLGIVVILSVAVPWRTATGPVVALPTVVLLLNPDLFVHASSGLETVLFAFMAVAFVASIPRLIANANSARWGVVAGGIGFALLLTRPDGGLVVAVALTVTMFVNWLQSRSQLGVLIAGSTFGAALVAYLSWKMAYFGHLLPNPYYMKATHTGWAGFEPTLGYLLAYRSPLIIGVLAMLVAAVPALRRGHSPIAQGRDWLVPAISLAVFIAWLGYTMRIVHEIGFAHRFSWHLVPMLTFGATVALAGLTRECVRPAVAVASWVILAAALLLVAWRVPAALASLRTPPSVPPLTLQFQRIGVALRDFGLSWDLRLLCSNAGITPYVARVHHIDPAGLTDDGFCRRTPVAQRNQYVATMRPDVVLWHLPPATPGATSLENDVRLSGSRYIRDWCLAAPESMDEGSKVSIRGAPLDRTSQQLFNETVFLRDFTTLVGEMSCGHRRWRMFVYVLRTSPHHDALVKHLSTRVDISSADVDPDGWPGK